MAETARVLGDLLGVTLLDRYVPIVPSVPWLGCVLLLAALLGVELARIRSRGAIPSETSTSGGEDRMQVGPSPDAQNSGSDLSTEAPSCSTTMNEGGQAPDLLAKRGNDQHVPGSYPHAAAQIGTEYGTFARTQEQALTAEVARLRVLGLDRRQVRRVLISELGVELRLREIRDLEMKAASLLASKPRKQPIR